MANEWIKDVQEPNALGREAFWKGRPIWANPLVGHAARAWTAGWRQGLAELTTHSGQTDLPESGAERRHLLTRHLPPDIGIGRA
jgi:hypothetical protein